MIELIKDLIEGYKERIKNPIISSLIISFSIYNWRPISILIFSPNKIEDRINYVENQYLNSNVIFYPIIFALAYTIIMPYLNVIATWIIRKANEIQNNRNNRKRLSVLEHRISEAKLERKIAEEIAGRKETEELTKTIQELKTLLEIKSNELNDVTSSYSKTSKELNDAIKKLSDENVFLKNTANNLESNNQYAIEINNLFTDFSNTSERKIRLFLKSNLRDDEVINLKTYAKVIAKPITEISIDNSKLALMLKAKLIRKSENNETYTITESGKRFIEEL